MDSQRSYHETDPQQNTNSTKYTLAGNDACAPKQRPKSWVRTPRALDAERGLTHGERSVYATINRVVQFRNGEISMPDLAFYSSRSERQAYRDILSLRKKRRIGFTSGGGRSKTNRYWLTFEYAGPKRAETLTSIGENTAETLTRSAGPPIENARASGLEKPEERETTTEAAIENETPVAAAGKTKTQAEKGEGQCTDLSQPEPDAELVKQTADALARRIPDDPVILPVLKTKLRGKHPDQVRHALRRLDAKLQRSESVGIGLFMYFLLNSPLPRPAAQPHSKLCPVCGLDLPTWRDGSTMRAIHQWCESGKSLCLKCNKPLEGHYGFHSWCYDDETTAETPCNPK